MIANSQQGRWCLRQTSWSFFVERASTSNFCCATDQNKPHILKYVSYDRSCLLQPCGKLFSWAPPVPLGNFYPLAPPPLRNFHWPSVTGGEGGYGYFLESHNKKDYLTSNTKFAVPFRTLRVGYSETRYNLGPRFKKSFAPAGGGGGHFFIRG